MLCAYKNCQLQGTEHISTYVKSDYCSTDGQIDFCSEHIQIIVELYSIYKALESGIPCAWIREPDQYLGLDNAYRKKDLLTDDFIQYLQYLLYDLDVIITARQTVQQSLKDEIPAEGHNFWLNSLKKLKEVCYERCIDRGRVWNRSTGKFENMPSIFDDAAAAEMGWIFVVSKKRRCFHNYYN